MAEEQGGLPDELEAWLDERAAETDRERDEVLTRAVTAYRLLSEHEEPLRSGVDLEEFEMGASPESVEELESRQADLVDEVSSLADRLDRVEDEFEADVEDVRDRVVQVMRVAQSKADADHTHEGLERRVTSIAADVEALRDSLDELESRVNGGFENYETILERLKETTDDLDDKSNRLASAVVDLRERANDLEAADARRSAVEELQTAANQHGITTAKCGDCRTGVHVGLLARPNCPHCGSVFSGIEPASGLLGSAHLTVGGRPALEGGSYEPGSPGEILGTEERQ